LERRRNVAISIMTRAESARSITAIGSPPIISTGTPNALAASSTRENSVLATMAENFLKLLHEI
jgi:hypothetical protein